MASKPGRTQIYDIPLESLLDTLAYAYADAYGLHAPRVRDFLRVAIANHDEPIVQTAFETLAAGRNRRAIVAAIDEVLDTLTG